MRSNRQLAIVLLAISTVVASVGCNDTEVIPEANGRLTIRVAMEPPAGARAGASPTFTWGRSVVSAVTLSPQGVTHSEIVGLSGINPVYSDTPPSADMIATTDSDVRTVIVPAGVYKLDELIFDKFILSVENDDPLLPPAGGGRCDENGNVVLSLSIPVSDEIGGDRAIRPSGVVTVTVPEGGEGALTIVLQGDALSSLLDSHAVCSGGAYSTVPPAPPLITPSDIAPLVSFR